jgi:hypothetical protein
MLSLSNSPEIILILLKILKKKFYPENSIKWLRKLITIIMFIGIYVIKIYHSENKQIYIFVYSYTHIFIIINKIVFLSWKLY